MTAHWGVPDPAAVKGTDEEVLRAFRDAFLLLNRRIMLFLSLPLGSIDKLALKTELDQIGREKIGQEKIGQENTGGEKIGREKIGRR